ncbi:MAG: Lrp/AsnC family transcriptional regulator [Peptococcaceae bacterium]|nr:Lrp/AsnC family transcriptional regulator [Peptococcaceae bacterium]
MPSPLTERERAIVRALQQELPLEPEPYRVLAERLGIGEEELLADIRALQEKGCLKRISIALRHKNVGYKVNVMIVWDIPDAHTASVGARFSGHPAVTHCYLRNPAAGFPYNIYTMVHAQSEADYAALRDDLCALASAELGAVPAHAELRSLRELKKIGMKYFLESPDEIIEE